jgi:arylsulfatase A-like enzyme
LAESLRGAGVGTVAFFSGPFLHPAFGFERGFDEYVDCTSYGAKHDSPPPWGGEASHWDVTNPILIREVGAWLQRATRAKRRFIFIHMWDVHYDYMAPRPYVDLFDATYTGSLQMKDFFWNTGIRRGMPHRDLEHLIAQYDAEIRYTDDTLGTILELLADGGMSRRSAIIVTADHGEEFFEHGEKGHRKSLFEEVLRVPLIISIPGVRLPVRRVSDVVSLIDVAPTVCELLAVRCPRRERGRSLVSRLEGSRTRWRGDALAELSGGHGALEQTALVRSEGKLIRWERTGRGQYFDRAELEEERSGTLTAGGDPKAYPRRIRRVARALDRSVDRLRRAATGRRGSAKMALPESTQKQLRALGYAGESPERTGTEEQTAPSGTGDPH